MADNPSNSEKWSIHGSNAEYWRSDNPYIVAWYRLGDNEYPVSQTLGQPALTDSGPRHHHLTTPSPLSSYLTYVSGIAPWSNSGVQFVGPNWTDSSTDRALRTNSDYYRDRTDQTTMGYHGLGNAITSGFTIMGWMQVPDSNTNRATPKKVWANIEDGISASDGEFQLHLRYTDYSFAWIFNSFGTSLTPGGAFVNVVTNVSPYGYFPIDEPFFFACQINKGAPASSDSVNEGSGISRVFLGTTVSGLVEVASEAIIPSTNFWRGDNTVQGDTFAYTIGADPQSARGFPNARNIPENSIVDEFIILNDGNISLDRLQHYMNSGIIQDDQDPLSLNENFIAQAPGTDDLLAYWSFDEGGQNTAPATSSDSNLDMIVNNVTFVDGIRGGSGVRPNSLIDDVDVYTLTTNKDGLPHVPGGSGLNFIFPESDQTWIGWVRSEGAGSRGGAIGHFGSTAEEHTACYWGSYLRGVATSRPAAVDVNIMPSGGSLDILTSVAGVSATNLPNAARTFEEGDWHLLAIVFDITHGFIRVVRDAIDVYPMLMTEAISVSGLNKQSLVDSGPDGAAFLLGNIDSTNRCSYDDWAIYDKVLSLPEMSGYAISGIDTPAPPNFASTNQTATLGYWPLNEITTVVNGATSGTRIDDASWYRHHLYSISGFFQQGSTLNSFIGSNSIQLNLSGSMIAINSANEHGANLSFNDPNLFEPSGFSAGCWMYLPSGDLQTQGNGSSGLFGDKFFMGVWGQSQEDQSWFLGMNNGKLEARFRTQADPSILHTIATNLTPVYNAPFFVGVDALVSGSQIRSNVYYSETNNDDSILVVNSATTAFAIDDALNHTGTSGFSLLNYPNGAAGFPSGTRIQGAFVYGKFPTRDGLIGNIKQVGIDNANLSSGSVSVTDPDNISHWKFDFNGAEFLDHGRANNILRVVAPDTPDSRLVTRAIHGSGAQIEQQGYLDTITNNPLSSGLNIGSDDAGDPESWTFLTWIRPNEIAPSVQSIIMTKGGSESGATVFSPANNLIPGAQVSGGVIGTASNNGDFLAGEWNHLAIVYDAENNDFTTILNGRRAGNRFGSLIAVPPNNSGLIIGGAGDASGQFGIEQGLGLSGTIDDTLLFRRALTLPEISGIAANTYNFTETPNAPLFGHAGFFISGIPQFFISGLVGTFFHGMAQDLALIGGHISGVSGQTSTHGGFIHGRGTISGLIGTFIHGLDTVSGFYGSFIHGKGIASGVIGTYTFGACEASSEFDITFNYRVVQVADFDSRIEIAKSDAALFDALIAVQRITAPPLCVIQEPAIGLVASGLPYTLNVSGSGIAYEDKKVERVRFTFADFKNSASGTQTEGNVNSGLYTASRVFDTAGWYTIKMEVVDSFGYRASCARPFLLLPSGSTSGAYLATLPGIEIDASPVSGTAIARVAFTHSISGFDTTSGILEYTDFADQQETLVNSTEFPVDTQFTNFVRSHDYTMPGRYRPVWAVSGSWGIVSDSIYPGIDYLS